MPYLLPIKIEEAESPKGYFVEIGRFDAIAACHPLRVVFRDSSFTEAAQKRNLFELFKQKCGWTNQEVQNNVRVI